MDFNRKLNSKPDLFSSIFLVEHSFCYPSAISVFVLFTRIVYIQSITLFFVIDRSQWHFLAGLAINFCHWLQSMTDVHKFVVIDWSQWHMAISCKINANQKSVIDQSMTFSKGAPYSRVSVDSVIDQSMTLFGRLLQKCHWPVNDSF